MGLAILTPAWMKYVLSDQTKKRFARFAREVFGIDEPDDRKAAESGIQKTEEFFQVLGMPATLSQAGVPADKLHIMAAEAVRTSGLSARSYVKLSVEDVEQILESCK